MRSPTEIVDKLALESPHDVWVKICASSDGDGGNFTWQDVTWLQLSRAVNIMAHWIDAHLGSQPKGLETKAAEGPVIAYMGVNDIRYAFFILATLKIGYTSFLPSPRNSQEIHLSLLSSTSCQTFVYTQELTSKVVSLSAANPTLRTFQVPSLDFFLHPDTDIITTTTPYPQPETPVSLSPTQNLLIVHSSGTSSGTPKPIPIKAGVFSLLDNDRTLDNSHTSPTPKPTRLTVHSHLYSTPLLLTALPFFHIMGINLLLARSIYHRGPLAIMSGDRGPVTAEMMVAAIEQTRPSSVLCAPSVVGEIWGLGVSGDGDGGTIEGGRRAVRALRGLESISYGGAGLDRTVGGQVSKVTRLINGIGATETFSLAGYVPERREDWEYVEWHPQAGVVMERIQVDDDDGGKGGESCLHELVIKRLEDGPGFQFVFQNFPELDEWRMGDLYEEHPTRKGLWRPVGRVDDLIVLSNGEKVNPTRFERAVEEHPWVRSASMVGTGKFQTGVIIEPEDEQRSLDAGAFLDQIWPWIGQANLQLPRHARVWRSMVRLAVSEKPFVRSGKGAVVRRATSMLYEREIGLLYGKRERPDEEDGTEADDESTSSVLDTVRQAVRSVLFGQKNDLDDEANFFKLGLDSLQVLELGRSLHRRYRHITQTIRLIYDNPSISKLALAIKDARSSHKTPLSSSKIVNTKSSTRISREERMSAMIHKYTQSLPRLVRRESTTKQQETIPPTPPLGYTILLTGSTGNLGTYLLHNLLTDSQISHIYCLNRTHDAAKKQAQSFLDCGLDIPFPPSPPGTPSTATSINSFTEHPNMTFIHSPDLSQQHLGLNQDIYELLEQHIDLVIHNAWPVNFNALLEEFEPAVVGMRRIIDFAAASAVKSRSHAGTKPKPHVVFVSSIASVLNYPAVRTPSNGLGSVDKERPSPAAVVTIPEESEADNSLPAKQGYGESKHVASCILAKAVEKSDIEGTIIRAGQLAGPVDGRGVWNKQEWLPSLIATSKTLGKVPVTLGRNRDGETIDWLPVDVAARSIIELALSRVKVEVERKDLLACFNLVNPRTTRWSDMVTSVQEFHKSRKGVEIEAVGFGEWFEGLMNVSSGDTASTEEMTRLYPALNLLDFFQGWSSEEEKDRPGVRFAVGRAVAESRTMAGVGPVDGEMMRRWLERWDF